jgi:hypothetical protein
VPTCAEEVEAEILHELGWSRGQTRVELYSVDTRIDVIRGKEGAGFNVGGVTRKTRCGTGEGLEDRSNSKRPASGETDTGSACQEFPSSLLSPKVR